MRLFQTSVALLDRLFYYDVSNYVIQIVSLLRNVRFIAIDSGNIVKTYSHAVKQYFPDYMGLIFKKMCQDCLLYYMWTDF